MTAANRMSDDLEQMERFAAGLLSFKDMSPYAKARFHIDLRKLVTARGGLSEDAGHFDKAITCDVLSELVERAMRRLVIELTARARKYMDDDKIEQLEAAVVAGPATVVPSSSRNVFTRSPMSGESSTKRMCKSLRSADDPGPGG
jgi:hypothetical protein